MNYVLIVFARLLLLNVYFICKSLESAVTRTKDINNANNAIYQHHINVSVSAFSTRQVDYSICCVWELGNRIRIHHIGWYVFWSLNLFSFSCCHAASSPLLFQSSLIKIFWLLIDVTFLFYSQILGEEENVLKKPWLSVMILRDCTQFYCQGSWTEMHKWAWCTSKWHTAKASGQFFFLLEEKKNARGLLAEILCFLSHCHHLTY